MNPSSDDGSLRSIKHNKSSRNLAISSPRAEVVYDVLSRVLEQREGHTLDAVNSRASKTPYSTGATGKRLLSCAEISATIWTESFLLERNSLGLASLVNWKDICRGECGKSDGRSNRCTGGEGGKREDESQPSVISTAPQASTND